MPGARPVYGRAPGDQTENHDREDKEMTDVHPVVKRTVAFVVALATVFALTQAALTRPAQAHNVAGWSWCTVSNQVCISSDANGYGLKYAIGPAQGYCLSLPWNDKLTGFDSHIGVPVHFWEHGNCNGVRRDYGANAWGNVDGWFNDRGTSYCIGPLTASVCGPYV